MQHEWHVHNAVRVGLVHYGAIIMVYVHTKNAAGAETLRFDLLELGTAIEQSKLFARACTVPFSRAR